MKTTKDPLEHWKFWSTVFMRLVITRYSSRDFQAEYPMGFVDLERRWKNVLVGMRKASKSEQASYEWFISEFSRLNPHAQIVMSGRYRQEWLDFERCKRMEYLKQFGITEEA